MPLLESTNEPELKGFGLEVWPADSVEPQALSYRDQIILGAQEAEMMYWEPEDAQARFASLDAFAAWAKNGRIIVGLTQKTTLSGICYFGKKNLDSVREFKGLNTVGLRMYEHASGQGLALPFFRAAHRVVRDYMNIDGLWLSVRADNDRARHIYERAGYRQLAEYGRHIYMAYDGDSS